TLDLGQLTLVNSPSNGFEIKADLVLKEGDLVGILPNNQVILLAPNLTERKLKSLSWADHRQWQKFISTVRNIFSEKSFQEIKTPTLVNCPGTEPSLDVFETEFRLESKNKKYYLPTSPELNLKKLLAEGAEKIFEIAPVFRNGEKTNRHSPEFLMLEWYRGFANLSRIKMDTIELIDTLSEKLKVEKPVGALTFTMADLFKQYCQFDLKPNTAGEELKALAQKLHVDVSSASTIDDYFYLIFMDKIENKWPQDYLVFVEKYPPYQAALARIGADGWAERFEVYWQGYELGNAFHELNDPVLQKVRAREDLEKKKLLNKRPIELDEAFFAALEFGLPPSAGIAVGLERLYMAFYKIKEISQLNQIYHI
ncbi:MAG: EF-P lysine aminoacylase EpmA, partial [Pseudobdellovibrio sp.]